MEALRRSRKTPISTGKFIAPDEAALIWFEKLQTHGPLPTPYLLEYTRHLRRNDIKSKLRLRDLFHEENTAHGGAYLIRPPQQRYTEYAHAQHAVYDLADPAKLALAERGLFVEIDHGGWWVHQFMVSCITASIELAILKAPGFRYIPQHEITKGLKRKVPYTTPNGKRIENHHLIPDALFGVEYPTGKRRYFALEADRANEINRSTNFDRKSFERSLLQYRELIPTEMYREAYGIERGGLMLLVVTTNAIKMQNMMRIVLDTSGGKGNNYVLFRTQPEFDLPFKPPAPLHDLFTVPWQRAGKEPFAINAA